MLRDWLRATEVYLEPRVVVVLLLGFASGLPLLLTLSTLTFWLAEAQVDKAAIGLFADRPGGAFALRHRGRVGLANRIGASRGGGLPARRWNFTRKRMGAGFGEGGARRKDQRTQRNNPHHHGCIISRCSISLPVIQASCGDNRFIYFLSPPRMWRYDGPRDCAEIGEQLTVPWG